MGSPINLTGLPSDYAVPLTAVEIRFGMGPSSGALGPYTALIIGNKTSAGSATVNLIYPNETTSMTTENDVINLFGPGSEAHRLYRRFVEVNRSTAVYIIAPAEDGSATTAGLTVTLATTATGPGVLRTFVGDEYVDVPIVTGSLPADIATAAAQKINNQTNWPVTASPSSSTYVITSKNKGLRVNEIRVRSVVIGSCGMTSSGAATSTALSGGTVTDEWTTALAAILPYRFYYIISPSSAIDAHTFDDLLTQILLQALPVSGLRQEVFAGFVGTQSAGSTIAANASVNSPRARFIWQEESEWTAGELAAQYAGAKALFDTTRSPKYNFDGFGQTAATQQFWKVPPQSQPAKRPTSGVTGSIASAVNNGLTCIATTKDGTGTYVVMDVTTKHKNGSNYDYRNRDGHITTVCDMFADQCEVVLNDMRSGKNLVDNPPQGTILTDTDTVYPNLIKAQIVGIINSHDSSNGGDGWFKNIETIKAGTRFQISSTNQSRSEGYVPAQVTNLHHQATLLVDDVSTLNY
jgi:phage tail sheath gpL-like